jgi:xylan 1,4-beta-xylosidase
MTERRHGASRRRGVLRAIASLPSLGSAPAAPRPLLLSGSARPDGWEPQGEFRRADFDMVGVFDVDWLLAPRFTRVLDAMAASPGAFGVVRVFGALNSGVREDVFPTSTGTTWPSPEAPMDFSVTLAALEVLVSRRLTPFLPLTFFPAAIAASPIIPPADLAAWRRLVRGFLDAIVARFGAEAISRWWFEVWNEPNMPPFWSGSFDRYLDLYRETAAAVREAGHTIRLGGPALAYLPGEGPALMERFLGFLRDTPDLPCDFLSLHRKGAWTTEEGAPQLSRLAEAAEATAAAALRLIPERCSGGLTIINNEADMLVGFANPYAPRMDSHFPAWLAASATMHTTLSERYAERGLRFMAAADNANQHLVRAPFDGRRALMTRTSAADDDLIKLPVFGFYELLRLLGDRHCNVAASVPREGLYDLLTVGEDRIAALLAHYPDNPAAAPVILDYLVRDVPWPRVNLVEFRIDGAHGNAFAAAGRRMSAEVAPGTAARRLRAAAELGVQAPLRSGLHIADGRLRLTLQLPPYATALVWVTPFDPRPPEAPCWLDLHAEHGNALLRWTAGEVPGFYSYELRRLGRDERGKRIAPLPLRAACWVDTAPPVGEWRYAVRVVTASGLRSAVALSPPLRIG